MCPRLRVVTYSSQIDRLGAGKAANESGFDLSFLSCITISQVASTRIGSQLACPARSATDGLSMASAALQRCR